MTISSVTTNTFLLPASVTTGTYAVTITGEIPVGIIASATISLICSNSPPTFSNTLQPTITVDLNHVGTMNLPSYSDPDGDSVSLTVGSMPVFTTFNNPVFTFSPTLLSQVGTFSILLALSDGINAPVNYSFTVTVTNTAPYFSPRGTQLLNQQVNLNSIK